jgi:hypothetical protein
MVGDGLTYYCRSNDAKKKNVLENMVTKKNVRQIGLLPADEFTAKTEEGIKQIQKHRVKRDKNDKNLGIVGSETLTAINALSESRVMSGFREILEEYKRPCNACGKFGKRQFKDEYKPAANGLSVNKAEKFHNSNIRVCISHYETQKSRVL